MENKFTLNNRDEVLFFENTLREYMKNRAQISLRHISLVDVYDKLQRSDSNRRIFTALLDIEINFVLLYCDISNVAGTWNKYFSKGKLEGGSILDSKDKFFGKMDIQRFSSSFVLRYRALWDKIMGLLILLFSPSNYENFYAAKSKKKSFNKIAKITPQILQISPMLVEMIDDSLKRFDEVFRTSEAHGTGSLRKWVFLMEPMVNNPSIKLIGYCNMINDMILKIGKLFENN